MKALSLWQPWASLIAHGVKRVETRGNSTNYRGPLLIHAAKVWGTEQQSVHDRLMANETIKARTPWALPFGAVVAVAKLVAVHRMTQTLIDAQTPLEREVGNWQVGRYAWVLEDVRSIPWPCIPLRGMQAAPFEVTEESVDAATWARLVAVAA